VGELPTKEYGYSTAKIVYSNNAYAEEIMKCPHLKQWLVATCAIDENVYVPSAFQLHEYCNTKGHKKCPFFAKSFSKKKEVKYPIPLREYA
jgi:hypothetical protein